MLDRRKFIQGLGATAFASATALLNPDRARAVLQTVAAHRGQARDLAADEDFWRRIQQAFTVDRSIINLNNGGVSPAPAIVQQAMKQHLDYSHKAPAYTMWRVLEPQQESVRSSLARCFDCSPEELALTRNASESMQILQNGIDLQPGDEVLATTHDYPRMLNTWKQRERRDGIVLRQFSLPIPAEDPQLIVDLYEQHISPRTRAILISHVVYLTGQIMPVRAVCALGRRKGIPVFVDGAHSLGHFTFTLADLDCEFFGSSLHKWLTAPHGTGMLYVRKERIGDIWPLQAAEESKDEDIRKFEEIGTHPAANTLAIAEAISFYRGIGPERKEERLRFLRNRWAERLKVSDRVRLHTSLKPGRSCAIATMQVEGIPSGALAKHLWKEHKILVVAIKHDDFEGIRVAPNVYTSLDEIDYFSETMERIIRNGID